MAVTRYQYDNHLGSACLELDENAAIISYEEYHPFGTTSYRSGISETEVSLKRYKYVGKERDEETGLYYYGARYYAAWIARFVSVDPLAKSYPWYTPYQYAGNKPIKFIDLDGLEEALPPTSNYTFSFSGMVSSFLGLDTQKPQGNGTQQQNVNEAQSFVQQRQSANQRIENATQVINKTSMYVGGGIAAGLTLPAFGGFVASEAALWSGSGSIPVVSSYLLGAGAFNMSTRIFAASADAIGQFGSYLAISKGNFKYAASNINLTSPAMTFLHPTSFIFNGSLSSALQVNLTGYNPGTANDVLLGATLELGVGKLSSGASGLFKNQIKFEEKALRVLENFGKDVSLQSQRVNLLKTTNSLIDPSFQYVKSSVQNLLNFNNTQQTTIPYRNE